PRAGPRLAGWGAGLGVGPPGAAVREPAGRVGRHVRMVKAGSGRAYYIGLRPLDAGEATAAVCVLARGADEGTVTHIDHPFTIATNRPISFPLYSSTTRSDGA